MELNYLKAFTVVYETRSISQAAKKLFITPQGLSRIISTLEQNLGDDIYLFNRTSQGVVPTIHAELLYSRVVNLVPQIDSMTDAVRNLGKEEKKFMLGVAYGALSMLSERKSEGLIRGNICCNEYFSSEIREMLSEGRLDYGIVTDFCETQGLVTNLIRTREIKLFVYEGHPLFSKDSVSIKDLSSVSVAAMPKAFACGQVFFDACVEHNVVPSLYAESEDALFLFDMCRRKKCLAVLPAYAESLLNMDGVRSLSFAENLRMKLYGIRKAERESDSEIIDISRFLVEKWNDLV